MSAILNVVGAILWGVPFERAPVLVPAAVDRVEKAFREIHPVPKNCICVPSRMPGSAIFSARFVRI